MIIEEIIFLNGACSRKGMGSLFFALYVLRFMIYGSKFTLCLPAEAS